MTRVLLLTLTGLIFGIGTLATASELVYTPVNPSFGGSPLNGAFLLNAAEAQNKFKEPAEARFQRDLLDSFEETLMRRVLSNLAGDIANDVFGADSDGISDGQYQVGDYEISVSTTDGGDVSVIITDFGTGRETRIEVPSAY